MVEEYIQKYEEFYKNFAAALIEKHNMTKRSRIIEIIKKYVLCFCLAILAIAWTVGAFSFGSAKIAAIIVIMGLPLLFVITQHLNPIKNSEYEFKKLFMEQFLSIFGVFEWKRGAMNTNISTQNNSIIFPQNFMLTYDDIIYGLNNDALELTIKECKTERNSFLTILPLVIPALGCSLFLLFAIIIVAMIVASTFLGSWQISGTPAYILSGTILLLIFSIFFKVLKMVWSSINKGNFEGLVIECAMPKNFSGHTYFYESNPFTNKNVSRSIESNMERVNLEDMEFNRAYNIFTDNQIEARYILTTAFIQRLNNIKNIFEAKYIRADFKDNKMTMIIHIGKDMFYFNQLKKISKSDFDNVFYEFCSLFEMIEYLKLNIKTGL